MLIDFASTDSRGLQTILMLGYDLWGILNNFKSIPICAAQTVVIVIENTTGTGIVAGEGCGDENTDDNYDIVHLYNDHLSLTMKESFFLSM